MTIDTRDFARLRRRWRTILTGGDFNPSEPDFARAVEAVDEAAATRRSSMTEGKNRTALWPDLPLEGEQAPPSMWHSFSRLEEMALAFATTGSRFEGDTALVAEIVSALDFLHQLIYHAGKKQFGNWWLWEIGSPRALTNICVLVDGHLDDRLLRRLMAAVDHFNPDPSMMTRFGTVATGANLTDKCQIVAVRGLLGERAERVAASRDALSPIFRYVTFGDGFYADGSFIQHTWVPYTGSYGVVLLGGIARVLALLADSPWEVTDPDRQLIFDAVEDSYAPLMYRGLMMDCVRGRAISRADSSDHTTGATVSAATVLLSQSAGEADARRFRELVKGWITRDSYYDYFATATPAEVALGRAAVADSVDTAPERHGHRQFPAMDRVVHSRPGWICAISMCSSWITRYEHGNGENLRGWHTGDGMVYLYTPRLDQYADGFWPTVDPYRLPGTTVDSQQLPDGAGPGWGANRPSTRWVGGASLGERYGAVGMEVDGFHSALRGKKSWFCLDEAVVALGTDISSTSNTAIETVVENRNLHADGTNRLVVDGVTQPHGLGWAATLPNPRWAHLDDVGGYLFLDGGDIVATREERTGSWAEINHLDHPKPPRGVTRRYCTLWRDHGAHPRASRYAYATVPTATAKRTRELASDPGIEVLANSGDVQALRVPPSGVTLVNFWAAGSVDGITASGPASVVVEHRGQELTVGVSDPTRTQATVRIQLNRPGFRSAEADSTITVEQTHPTLSLVAEVGGSLGSTHTVTFSRTGGTATERQVTDLVPDADAHVRAGQYADVNYGSAGILWVKSDSGADFDREAYLRFALRDLEAPVERAVLWLRARVADSRGTSTEVQARAAGADWNENAVTWNSRPSLGSSLDTRTVADAESWQTAVWVDLDVTEHVQAAQRQGKEATIALVDPARRGLAVGITSRQSPHPPLLQITSRPS